MTLMHRFASIARWILRRDRAEQDLDRELQTFVDLAAVEHMRDGVSPEEARRLARLALGGIEQTKERVRSERHGAWLDEVGRDIRYAGRVLVKQRGFTAVVVLTLALGIGANTAIFSLIDALLLRSLPVSDPDELVLLRYGTTEEETAESFSYAMIRALADRSDIFDGVGGFSGNSFNVGASGSLVRVRGALVTGAFYDTLGLQPQIGRLLMRSDDEPNAALVAVISDGYWERQFGRRHDALGQTLLLNGVPVTIVGVSPRGFVGANVGSNAEITVPVSSLLWLEPPSASLLDPGNFWLRALARPAGGRAQAEARLTVAWRHVIEPVLAPHWPAWQRAIILDAVPHLSSGGTGWTYLREIYVRPLFVLMVVVGVVLLIACANVAGLLLARASARQREVAVRLAVGASRGRVVRQFLIEDALLALTGAAVGVGFAWVSGTLLLNLIAIWPGEMLFDLTPNRRVLTFTSAIAIATALAFGIVPALHATAAGPIRGLNDRARATAPRSRVLSSLVSVQVALSLVLLVGAALFVRTLQNLQRLDPGFTSNGVLLANLEGRRTGVPSALLDDLRQIPGVVSATVSTHTPLSGARWSEPAVPAGQPIPERDNTLFVGAGPGFFEAIGIRLLAGREFTTSDGPGTGMVAIVNERFAQRHFPTQAALGQHLSARVRGQERDLEIVGIVRNTSVVGLRETPPATVYVAYTQLTSNFPTTVVVRADGRLAAVSSSMRQILQRHLPNAITDVVPLTMQVWATMVRERMMASLAAGFGFLAVALAAVGLYGLLSYRVSQRTKEIGIRMAVGAQRRQVIGLVLNGAITLVAAGIVAGVPATWAASRWIESMLFGLESTDAGALGAAIAVLTAVAVVSAYVPAWRASRVDPLPALRHE